MRAFVRMREVMISHKEMARGIDDMECKCDAQFKVVFDAIRRLMELPDPPKKRQIGYIRGRCGILGKLPCSFSY